MKFFVTLFPFPGSLLFLVPCSQPSARSVNVKNENNDVYTCMVFLYHSVDEPETLFYVHSSLLFLVPCSRFSVLCSLFPQFRNLCSMFFVLCPLFPSSHFTIHRPCSLFRSTYFLILCSQFSVPSSLFPAPCCLFQDLWFLFSVPSFLLLGTSSQYHISSFLCRFLCSYNLFPVPGSVFQFSVPCSRYICFLISDLCSLFLVPSSQLPSVPYTMFWFPCFLLTSLFSIPCFLFSVPSCLISLFPVPFSLFPVSCSLFPFPFSLSNQFVKEEIFTVVTVERAVICRRLKWGR